MWYTNQVAARAFILQLTDACITRFNGVKIHIILVAITQTTFPSSWGKAYTRDNCKIYEIFTSIIWTAFVLECVKDEAIKYIMRYEKRENRKGREIEQSEIRRYIGERVLKVRY